MFTLCSRILVSLFYYVFRPWCWCRCCCCCCFFPMFFRALTHVRFACIGWLTCWLFWCYRTFAFAIRIHTEMENGFNSHALYSIVCVWALFWTCLRTRKTLVSILHSIPTVIVVAIVGCVRYHRWRCCMLSPWWRVLATTTLFRYQTHTHIHIHIQIDWISRYRRNFTLIHTGLIFCIKMSHCKTAQMS